MCQLVGAVLAGNRCCDRPEADGDSWTRQGGRHMLIPVPVPVSPGEQGWFRLGFVGITRQNAYCSADLPHYRVVIGNRLWKHRTNDNHHPK